MSPFSLYSRRKKKNTLIKSSLCCHSGKPLLDSRIKNFPGGKTSLESRSPRSKNWNNSLKRERLSPVNEKFCARPYFREGLNAGAGSDRKRIVRRWERGRERSLVLFGKFMRLANCAEGTFSRRK